ncbi:signal transduction histidine kinase [Chitinophaga polysaccharea]|uniref:histidine kinase n=1 Tax=Chitinophaga polysaccharea TaxID=1293035 RepID=A0A561PM69_9BACT|nr:ATP-binding protein [Chitinophaga polysaccharea]TWF39222.1 signal transduction histidine kinase [Chitinophaga polysaccharea]
MSTISAKPTRYQFVCLAVIFFLLMVACKQQKTNSDHPGIVNPISGIVDSMLVAGQMDDVPHFLDSAYAKLKNPGPYDLWIKYNHLADLYIFYTKNIPLAKANLDSMFFVLRGKEKMYSMEYASTLYSEGDLSMAAKQYAQAYKSYFSGRQFVQKYLDTCNYGRFSNKLGFAEYFQEKYQEAIVHFKQAFSEFQHCKSGAPRDFDNRFLHPQSALNSIALCFERANMPDSAIFYYTKAEQFIQEALIQFPDKKLFAETALGVVYGNLGGTYAKTGNFEMAEQYLKESIRLNDRAGAAMEDAQTAKIKLIRLYLDNRRLPAASALLDQVEQDLRLQRGKSVSNDNVRLRWRELKWRYNDAIGDLAGAYHYSQRYYQLRDSLNNVKAGLKEADLETGIRDAGQQYQIALLHKNNQLKTAYLLAAVIFSILTILILFLLWKNLQRSRRNVAELITLNQQVEEKNHQTVETLKALEKSYEENTRIMKVVAHDLRNPIGAITGLCAIMLADKHHQEKDRNMLKMIESSGHSSLTLINDLLYYSMQYELQKEPVELGELLRYAVDMVRLKAMEKQQRIDLQTTRLTLNINREKIWRVFSNLLSNAIKFSPHNSNIGIDTKIEPDHVTVSVQDQGIGIPATIGNKIFDLFTEAKRTGTGGERPFGMGLAISKQIAEAHGGAIWFESTPGEGATFYVKLPLK